MPCLLIRIDGLGLIAATFSALWLSSLMMSTAATKTLVLALFLVLSACTGAEDLSTSETATPSPSPTLRLSEEKVRSDLYEGLGPDARFIMGTSTGGLKIRPRRNVRPGQRVRLEGSGCTEADSVFVRLERVEPPDEHAHDVETTRIRMRRFPAGSSGWSGHLRIPKNPEVGAYTVQAVCERDGHLYRGRTGWDVYVGQEGP